MARHKVIVVGLVVGLLAFGALTALTAGTVDWWVMVGGGGRDTAGNLALDSTQGQWLVGTDASGGKEVSAGFWYGLSCYPLTVTADPAAGGTVTADPAPNCGSNYSQGTAVELTAVSAGGGYVFDHWSGDAAGTDNPVQVTMNGARSVTAHFEPMTQPCYTLTVSADPPAGGRWRSSRRQTAARTIRPGQW